MSFLKAADILPAGAKAWENTFFLAVPQEGLYTTYLANNL